MATIVKPPCDEGVIRGEPAARRCTDAVGRWVLAATILGSSMAFIDGSVVNVVLPVLQEELTATVSQMQWVVEAYALLLASLMLVGGSLGDRHGRRRVFALGITVFAAASVWCGTVQTANQLIVARGAQGIGGALLVPGSLALISALFDRERRGRAIGTWSGYTAVTAALGPVLGGWLVDNLSWRWVFFINVPLAAIVLLILFTRVPETRGDDPREPLDWMGALLATTGLGALVFGLIESANLGLTHPVVLGLVGAGTLVLVGFVRVEARSPAPMMPPSLFRSRTFAAANVVTLLLYAALGGALFFVPFNLIQVQGYSATEAGAAFLPLILVIFLLSGWAGGLVPRFGARVPLVLGSLVATVGYLLLAALGIGGSYWTTFFPAVLVLGLGMALIVAPLTTAVMASVDAKHAGIASGVNNAASRAAGLLAVAVLGVVILGSYGRALDARLARSDVPDEIRREVQAQQVRLTSAVIPPDLPDELRTTVERAMAESFVAGFRLVMQVAAALALSGMLVASFIRSGLH